jgi:hypothetical protein
MTDLPAPLREALHGAKALLIDEINGPNKTQLQFWAVPLRGMIVVQLLPDGLEVFRPICDSNSTEPLLDALRVYLTRPLAE